MERTKNQKIIEGIVDGNHQILKSFYKKNLPIIKRLVMKRYGTNEDVEDIFQDAMILLYHQLRYKNLNLPNVSVHTYFIGICKNLWRNQFRKIKSLEHLELIEKHTTDYSESIDDLIVKNEKKQLLNKHFNKLPTSSKNILTLILEGRSTKDIALITGYSEGYTRKKRSISKNSLLQLICKDPLFFELQEGSTVI